MADTIKGYLGVLGIGIHILSNGTNLFCLSSFWYSGHRAWTEGLFLISFLKTPAALHSLRVPTF